MERFEARSDTIVSTALPYCRSDNRYMDRPCIGKYGLLRPTKRFKGNTMSLTSKQRALYICFKLLPEGL